MALARYDKACFHFITLLPVFSPPDWVKFIPSSPIHLLSSSSSSSSCWPLTPVFLPRTPPPLPSVCLQGFLPGGKTHTHTTPPPPYYPVTVMSPRSDRHSDAWHMSLPAMSLGRTPPLPPTPLARLNPHMEKDVSFLSSSCPKSKWQGARDEAFFKMLLKLDLK